MDRCRKRMREVRLSAVTVESRASGCSARFTDLIKCALAARARGARCLASKTDLGLRESSKISSAHTRVFSKTKVPH